MAWRRQDWTNAGRLLIGPLGINFREILIEINKFSLKAMHLKMSSAKWQKNYQSKEVHYQSSHWNMLLLLEKSSVPVIFLQIWADGQTLFQTFIGSN